MKRAPAGALAQRLERYQPNASAQMFLAHPQA